MLANKTNNGVFGLTKVLSTKETATNKGGEQLIIELNGGIESGQLANKINAAAKEIYINTGRLWLNNNIPNWEHVLKFQ